MKHIFCYLFDISKIRESCNIVTMSKKLRKDMITRDILYIFEMFTVFNLNSIA